MNDNILKLAFDIKSFTEKFKNKKNKMIALNNVYTSNFLFFEHFISSKVFHDSPYRNLLINYFKKSEILYPGSSFDTAVKTCNLILGNNNTKEEYLTDKKLDSIMHALFDHTDIETYELFKTIINFSGPDATLTCDKTDNTDFSVTKNNFPTFTINLHEDFIPIYFSKNKTTTKIFNIAIVDAFIERESELMTLIEDSNSKKLDTIVICRGISETAVYHLKNILLRNNIKLYPFISKFSDKDPFILEDLASALGTRVVSNDTNDNIYVDTVEKSTIKKVKISPIDIKLYEVAKESIEIINNQIKNARKNNNNDVIDYLNKRKSRISPNNVEVLIPKSRIRLLKEIKSLIAVYNRLVVFGVYKNKENKFISVRKEDVSNQLSNSLYKNIKQIGYVVKLPS